jgi:hypothetical protein
MKIVKTNTYRAKSPTISQEENVETQLKRLDADLDSVVTAFQGRVRFGTGTDGDRGENLSGEFQQFTTSATPDAENTIAHTVGAIPVGYIVLWQDKAGSLYQGPTTGTNWTSSNVYLKSDVASVTFLVFLLK